MPQLKIMQIQVQSTLYISSRYIPFVFM